MVPLLSLPLLLTLLLCCGCRCCCCCCRCCCCRRASLQQLFVMLDLSRPVRSVLLWFHGAKGVRSEVGGGSSTAFPRLVIRELRASGNASRFVERPMSPDLSSFSNTGVKAAAMLAISSSVRPANRACSNVPLKKEARLLG